MVIAMGTVRRRFLGALLLAIVITVTLALTYRWWQPWAARETGSANSSGTPPNYNYWSGFGSVFPWEIGFFVGVWAHVYQNMRKANCHAHGCWRLGSYPVQDYVVCKRHHRIVTGTDPTIDHLKVVHRNG